MMNESLVTLVGENLSQEHGNSKWFDTVLASDGYVYGIPWYARHVVQFDMKDQSSKAIGDDLCDDTEGWYAGVEADNGCIYCMPASAEESMLKIDTHNQVTQILTNIELPESDIDGLRWGRGTLAGDGCIYFFPCDARHILKVDPRNDTVSSVGNDLGEGERKYSGTVKADDGCLYGIPELSKQIVKFDPSKPNTVSLVGHEAEIEFDCAGNGVLGADGNIYFMSRNGGIHMIDVANASHSIVAQAPQISDDFVWPSAMMIVGKDGNIYVPPFHAPRVLKYDINTKKASFVGKDIGNERYKYYSGALNPTDGKIYCLPCDADQVLSIDTNVPTQSHHQNDALTRFHDQAMVEDIRGEDDTNRNQRRRVVVPSDSISIRTNASNCQSATPRGDNRNLVAPCAGIENNSADVGVGHGDGAQATVQGLLQVLQVVEQARGMQNPHPTITANVERMAEASTILTNRFLEHYQIQNDDNNDDDDNGN